MTVHHTTFNKNGEELPLCGATGDVELSLDSNRVVCEWCRTIAQLGPRLVEPHAGHDTWQLVSDPSRAWCRTCQVHYDLADDEPYCGYCGTFGHHHLDCDQVEVEEPSRRPHLAAQHMLSDLSKLTADELYVVVHTAVEYRGHPMMFGSGRTNQVEWALRQALAELRIEIGSASTR